MRQAKPRHDAGAKAFGHDIGAFGQLLNNCTALGGFHVDGKALLAPVKGDGMGRHVAIGFPKRAHPITMQRFDLDHVGPILGHDLGRMGACDTGSEIQHPQVRKRFFISHVTSLFTKTPRPRDRDNTAPDPDTGLPSLR